MKRTVLWFVCACTGGEQPPPTVADLEVSLLAQPPAMLEPLGAFESHVQLRNAGPEIAEAVRISHPLGGLDPILQSPPGCTRGNDALVCDIPELAVGITHDIVTQAHAPVDDGPFVRIVEVTSASIDPDAADNVASYTSTVVSNAELSVVFDGGLDEPLEVTGTLQRFYDLHVTNAGPSLARDVTVDIESLDGMIIDRLNFADFICERDTVTGLRIDCLKPFHSPGTLRIAFGATAPSTGTFRIRATLSTSTPGDVADDNIVVATTIFKPNTGPLP